MKILIAGDTHIQLDHVNYLLTIAEENDIEKVFVLGDFGAWEHMSRGVEFFDSVGYMAKNMGITVYFLDGNHDKTSLVLEYYDKPITTDLDGFLICRPHLRYAKRGHRWMWDDVRFIALGGAYSVDKEYRLGKEWEHADEIRQMVEKFATSEQADMLKVREYTAETQWFPEEEMTDEDMERILVETLQSPGGTERIDIMLTHDKPRGSSPDFNRKNNYRCHPNQDRIQRAVLALQPHRLFHGHLHYRYTDVIRCGDDDRWTTVDGLDCDSHAARKRYLNQETMKRYSDPTESWMILDLDEYKKEYPVTEGIKD